ncbi:DUF1552 domain-containing protein [Frigoriglobus tundricola]|uniref:DUF1552 domain-containing protein n=1 Tax=Frigoriglobus tundricola TaxID=2774151 RepID=A0A6M5Z1P9_9BACT|nr:DUF1552 domain-containing protein [Frigoriglobus tundricola]QJW99423.1 hypothetical protein FTUN_7035 [Frigoriglobus tundricola]
MIRTLPNRRVVLRAAGVSLALPWLESVCSAGSGTPSAAPQRLVFVYAPNGKHMPDWAPTTEGAKFDLPATLKPLEAVRDHVSVLSGLCLRTATAGGDGPGDHARAMAAFLTGVRPKKTSGADVRNGVSVDQVAATVLGRATRFASLEVGCEGGKTAGPCDNGYSCAYQTNLSWRGESTPMPKETDPRRVFDHLFGDMVGADADPARAKRDRDRRSVLDFVAEDARELGGKLAGTDRRKLDEYLTGVREIEQRIQKAQPQVALGADALARPTGVPEQFGEHARLLGDLVVLAFQADLTRVVTFALGNDGSNRSYREVGVADGHHDLSHHAGDAGKHGKLRAINRLHVAQFAHLVERLKGTRESDGPLLNRCTVVYGSGIRDGDRHDHDDLPILLAGGGARAAKGGRHIRYAAGTPLCNLYLALLDRVGIRSDRFGDSTGPLAGLDG